MQVDYSACWIMPEAADSWSLNRSVALSPIGSFSTTAECVWRSDVSRIRWRLPVFVFWLQLQTHRFGSSSEELQQDFSRTSAGESDAFCAATNSKDQKNTTSFRLWYSGSLSIFYLLKHTFVPLMHRDTFHAHTPCRLHVPQLGGCYVTIWLDSAASQFLVV